MRYMLLMNYGEVGQSQVCPVTRSAPLRVTTAAGDPTEFRAHGLATTS